MKRTILLASLGIGVGVMLSGGLVLAGSLTHNRYLSMFDAVGKSQEYQPHVVVVPKQADEPEEVKVEQVKSETPGVVSSGTTSAPVATVVSSQPVVTKTDTKPRTVVSATERVEQLSDPQHPTIYKKTIYCDLTYSDGTTASIVGKIIQVDMGITNSNYYPCSKNIGN